MANNKPFTHFTIHSKSINILISPLALCYKDFHQYILLSHWLPFFLFFFTTSTPSTATPSTLILISFSALNPFFILPFSQHRGSPYPTFYLLIFSASHSLLLGYRFIHRTQKYFLHFFPPGFLFFYILYFSLHPSAVLFIRSSISHRLNDMVTVIQWDKKKMHE